jgi:hypothetical protein
VRLLHELAKIHASFDDPDLVSRAGLVPVMALAQRAGLARLAGERVAIAGRCGVNPHLKVGCLVGGMIAGADSIGDMDLLRHGAMPALLGGVRAPSTLGSFLRAFTWGNVLQLQKAHREFLGELACRTPLLPGADVLAFIDIDSMQKRVYRHKKQGAAFGHTKIGGKSLLVRGLNALAATISTPPGRPGDRRHPAARRQRELRPRGRVAGRRSGHHRPRYRVHRGGGGAGGLGVLLRCVHRRRPPGRGVLLGHRADELPRPGRNRRHRRGRLDPCQIPPGHLG